MDMLKRLALVLIIIGAINWGLIGFFTFDLVAFIFNGQTSIWSRIIYALVGLSGLYSLSLFFTGIKSIEEMNQHPSYMTEISNEFNDYAKKDKTSNKNKIE